MTIRTATMQDKDNVLKLFDEFNSLLKANETLSEKSSAIFDEIVSRNDTKIFIAEEDGQVLGITTLYLLPNIRHGWHRGHIEDFFVTADSRGKGVGTQLFNGVKDYCVNNGIKVIKLDSGNELVNAHKFYEKNGGKTTERFFRFDL
jgi:GNAT superfamily N-acetyltransferase